MRVGPTFGPVSPTDNSISVAWGINGDSPAKVRIFRTPGDAGGDFVDGEPWRTVSWTWAGLRSGTRYDLHVACVYPDGDIKRNTLTATTSGPPAPEIEAPQEDAPQDEAPQDEAPQDEAPQNEVQQDEVPQDEATPDPVPAEVETPARRPSRWHEPYKVVNRPKLGQVGATSPGRGRIDVFWRNPASGSLFQSSLDGTDEDGTDPDSTGGTSGTDRDGTSQDREDWQLTEVGPMTGAIGQVTAASAGPDRTDVFYRSAQHRLLQRFWTPSDGWSAEIDLGGNVAGRPDAVSWAPGRIDVFYRGADNQLIQRFQEPGQDWSGEIDLGGRLAGDPAVASRVPYALDVLYRDQADRLIHRCFLGTTWGGEIDLGPMSTTRPDFVSGVTAASWSPDRTDMFYVGGGTAHRLFQRSWERGRWNPEIDLGAGFAGVAPCVTSTGPGRLELFYLSSTGQLPSLFLHRYGP